MTRPSTTGIISQTVHYAKNVNMQPCGYADEMCVPLDTRLPRLADAWAGKVGVRRRVSNSFAA